MPDAPRQLPPKKEVAIALLEGPSLFVHLDPRRPGVTVPKWFTGQPQLVLQLGLNMAIPIPDLKVEDDALTCTLSFNRAAFWCRLPWNAVYALVGEDGRGMVWPDDVPPEVALQMQKQQGQAAAAKTPARKGKPKLNAVDGRGAGDGDEPPRPTKLKDRRPARVPAPAPSGPGDAALRDPDVTPIEPNRREDDAPLPADDDEVARRAQRPSERPGEKKPKRELPPYLRVIK